ncbi:MAG: aminoacyl-histidine dipeptidase [Bacilli bacterium]|nr:aminoacyl-histidine dipeptidase [Bacilli bacterium]
MNNTIHFFKEISKIPRESGNESQIAQYLCEFAKSRNLYCEIDKFNNVFIKKENKNCSPLILQAHTDMVCEKLPEKVFNFEKDSIEIIEQDGYLCANGTTLGADNGIGVAQILSILDSNIPCNIEAVFTTSEETSMDGAIHFDASKLKGKRLLNLDGFEENTIVIESAAFYDVLYHDQYELQDISNTKGYQISLSGLLGGHSGADINKNRGNASIILAEFLKELPHLQISDFSGGTKFNVIPSNANAKIITSISETIIQEKIKHFLNKKSILFPSLDITIQTCSISTALSSIESQNWLNWILKFRHGVFYSHNDLPTTSINLGVVDLKHHLHKIGIRSSKKVEEDECLQYLKNFAYNNHLSFEILGYQPGFESNSNSKFIQNIIAAHPTELFSKIPETKSIHATVEVGFFKEKIPDLEIAIISPNIKNAHTPKESVEIESIKKVDQWIINIISVLK